MFNDVPENDREKKLIDGGLDLSRLMNISLVNREGNAVIRRHLESLPLESFDSVSRYTVSLFIRSICFRVREINSQSEKLIIIMDHM